MEVTVDASSGVPEDHVVSIRVGDVRRQAPLKKLKNHALTFPCALEKAAEEPIKIEVLSPEAAELVVLRPGSASYRVPLSSVSSKSVVGTSGTTEPVGGPMTLDIHLGKEGKLPPRSKSRSGSLSTAGQRTDTGTSTGTYEAAATSAREYLETHKLLQYMQVMLRAVAERQPEDPFAYMRQRMQHQMNTEDHSATRLPENTLDSLQLSQMTNSEAAQVPAPTQSVPKSQESETVIQASPAREAGATQQALDSTKATTAEDTDGTFDELRLSCKEKLCDSFATGQLKTLLQDIFQATRAADTDVHATLSPAPLQMHAADPPPPSGERAMLQQQRHQQQQQQQPLTQEDVLVAVERLKADMHCRTCVCVLGGRNEFDEILVAELARKLGARCDDNIAFVTNGLPGVQTVFAQNLGAGSSRLWHLAHTGSLNDPPKVGEVLPAGHTFEQQKTIFASLGEVYITVAGGPGVADEARVAYARSALIVPLVRTGGASAGEFNFPKEALVRPLWASEDDWKFLVDRSLDVERYTESVARIVLAGVSEARRDAAWETRDKEIQDIEETTRVIQDENRNLAERVEALERRLVDCYPEKTELLS